MSIKLEQERITEEWQALGDSKDLAVVDVEGSKARGYRQLTQGADKSSSVIPKLMLYCRSKGATTAPQKEIGAGKFACINFNFSIMMNEL